PTAPGTITAQAVFKSSGKGKKAIIRLEIRRPDGSVAKQKSGGSPLTVSFVLSAAELAKFKGKAWEVRASENVPGQPDIEARGQMRVSFPVAGNGNGAAKGTVFDNSKKPLDLGGEGAETEVKMTLPNKPGRLQVEMTIRDPRARGKKLLVQ